MACIWVVVLTAAQLANVVKHLVLALTWHRSVWEDTWLQILIERVRVELVLYEKVQLLAQVLHEIGAWWDGIAVKEVRHRFSTRLNLLFEKGAFARSSEATRSLLIHFGAWGHSIDGQEDILFWLDQMHNLVDGFHDGGPELLLVFHSTDSLMQLWIITMHAIVHNTIQVEVQIVCIEITKNLLVHILSSVSWSVYQISF